MSSDFKYSRNLNSFIQISTHPDTANPVRHCRPDPGDRCLWSDCPPHRMVSVSRTCHCRRRSARRTYCPARSRIVNEYVGLLVNAWVERAYDGYGRVAVNEDNERIKLCVGQECMCGFIIGLLIGHIVDGIVGGKWFTENLQIVIYWKLHN